jgi:hypothetical protein
MPLLETSVRGKNLCDTRSSWVERLEAPRWSDWMLGSVLGRGERWVGQIGGKISPAHV